MMQLNKSLHIEEQIVAEIGKEKMELNLHEVDATINARVREMAEADC